MVGLYVISGIVVLVASAILSMAGLGAAFIFVPLFYWLGVPLREAMPTALLLNTISLAFATASYMRNKLVDYRAAIPILIAAVLFSPLGAYSSKFVDRSALLWLFAAFLVFAGTMMLFYKPAKRLVPAAVAAAGDVMSVEQVEVRPTAKPGLTSGIGLFAGFMGGLLGVGGGNFIVPVLNWLGFRPKSAAATTAFVVVFSSLAGFLGHASLGGINFTLLWVTGVAAIIGALAGSWLMQHKMTGPQLKKIIGSLLYVMAIKIIFDLL